MSPLSQQCAERKHERSEQQAMKRLCKDWVQEYITMRIAQRIEALPPTMAFERRRQMIRQIYDQEYAET